MTPWDEWWGMALKDESNPQIALLPLHPDVRARFDESAAWEFARSMCGKPYGYHNMIFSWIDTASDNYPPPLDANLVGIIYRYIYTYIYLLLLVSIFVLAAALVFIIIIINPR